MAQRRGKITTIGVGSSCRVRTAIQNTASEWYTMWREEGKVSVVGHRKVVFSAVCW
jgi:hypothetical protein